MFDLFEKKILIYKKKDRETWLAIKDALKEGGLTGVRASHYLQETVMAGGCGAKLDPRDFSGKGKIDREIYCIRVRESDEAKAREILRENGIVPEITENITMDAAKRAALKKGRN